MTARAPSTRALAAGPSTARLPAARAVTARVLAAGLGAVLLLAGCGVPVEDAPRTVDLLTPSRAASDAPSAAVSGPAAERLYLVRAGTLVAVQRRLPVEPGLQELLRDLLAGPTAAEQDRGLGTALGPGDGATSVQVSGETAYVDLPAGADGAGRDDDVLAFGQIVCTLTSRRGVRQVVFTRQGVRISVPLPDASLSLGPLVAADYAGLIAAN